MTEENTQIPESDPLHIFCDKGRVLFLTYQVTHVLMKNDETGEPITTAPIWNAHMAVGAFCSKPVELGEEGSSVWAFIDDDDNLLALDMPEPAQNGVPREEVISILRQILTEEEITEIMETVSYSQQDMFDFLNAITQGNVQIVGIGAENGDAPKNLISEDTAILEEIFSTDVEVDKKNGSKKRFLFGKDK